jgi:hypothetical protein
MIDKRVVSARIPASAIPALPFAPFELRQGAVKAHVEDVEWREQIHQPTKLVLRFDDIIDNDVISRRSQCGKASIIAVK